VQNSVKSNLEKLIQETKRARNWGGNTKNFGDRGLRIKRSEKGANKQSWGGGAVEKKKSVGEKQRT